MDYISIDRNGEKRTYQNIELPSKCPRCKHAIMPIHKYIYRNGQKGLSIGFLCTNCDELFVAKYSYSGETGIGSGRYKANLIRSEPVYPEVIEFSETISKLSSTFIETYNQAMSAESYNLSQIVGIGLRKSLEFLIKDYLSYIDKPNDENYKQWSLGKCINDGIKDINIQKIAKRAVWLGNDETHYIKKWEGKDIEDLKILTKITVNFIENDILAKKYSEEMIES